SVETSLLPPSARLTYFCFFFQAEDGIRDSSVTGVQTCALPISAARRVLLDGRDITGVQPHQTCRMGLGRSFQRTNIFPKLTVFRSEERRVGKERRSRESGKCDMRNA